MSTLQQLQGRLAFAHAAVANQQQTLAVYLHQNAVTGNPGGQGRAEVGNDAGGQGGSGLSGAQDGDAVLFCHLQALLICREIPGNQKRRGLVGEETVKDGGPLLRRFFLNVADFHIAQDLQPHGLVIVEVTGQLESRPGNVLYGQTNGLVIRRGIYDFQLEVPYQCSQRNAVGYAHM